MNGTKNFSEIFELINDSSNFGYEISENDKKYMIEKIRFFENEASKPEQEIKENSVNISSELRNFLERFLRIFMVEKNKERFISWDIIAYNKSLNSFKISFLDKELGVIDKDIVESLYLINNVANYNLHDNDPTFKERISIDKTGLTNYLSRIYNVFYWYYDQTFKRKFSGDKYYKNINEKEPRADHKVKEIFYEDTTNKDIVVNDKKFLNILFDESIKFFIPVYQRKYAWKEEQIDELFSDLFKRAEDDKSHFFGVVTLSNLSIDIKSGKKIKKVKIVDGQQRFTTITLIIRALYDSYLRESKSEEKIDKKISSFINSKNLPIDRFDDKNSEIAFKKIWEGNYKKLVFPEIDNFGGTYEDYKDLNLFRVFKYITNILKKYDVNKLDDLYKGLRNLVVGINWTKNYDEFELFESINSKGLTLTNYDIFKSFILSLMERINENDSEKYKENSEYLGKIFDKYIYEKLEIFIKKDDTFQEITDKFLKSYVNYYGNVKANENRIFSQFKKIFIEKLKLEFEKEDNFTIEEFKFILREIAIFLNVFLLLDSGEKEIWRKSIELNGYYKYFYTIDETVFSLILISYFLSEKRVKYSDYGNVLLLNEKEEFIKILKLIEAWRIRVSVKNLRDSGNYSLHLNNFIKSFNKRLNQEVNKNRNFYDVLSESIDEEEDVLKFQNDNEFVDILSNESMFNSDRLIRDIMLRIVEYKDDNIDEYNLSNYEIYPIIEKSERKRSGEWNEFLKHYNDVNEFSLSKIGNHFLHRKNLKIKKNEKNNFDHLINNLSDDNFTTNISNEYSILSLKSLKNYYGKNINNYFNPRSESIAKIALEIFKK